MFKLDLNINQLLSFDINRQLDLECVIDLDLEFDLKFDLEMYRCVDQMRLPGLSILLTLEHGCAGGEGKNHRLIKITDRTLDVVFTRFV